MILLFAWFLLTISEILGTEQWLKEILSCHHWDSIEIDVLYYDHHWREPCHTQVSTWKRYNNFKCALRQRWELLAQSTPKLRKAAVARHELGLSHFLKLKINEFIFTKQIKMKDRDLHNSPVSPVQPAEQATSSSSLGQQCDSNSETMHDSPNVNFIENCEDPASWPKRLSSAHRDFLIAKGPHKLDLKGFHEDLACRKL